MENEIENSLSVFSCIEWNRKWSFVSVFPSCATYVFLFCLWLHIYCHMHLSATKQISKFPKYWTIPSRTAGAVDAGAMAEELGFTPWFETKVRLLQFLQWKQVLSAVHLLILKSNWNQFIAESFMIYITGACRVPVSCSKTSGGWMFETPSSAHHPVSFVSLLQHLPSWFAHWLSGNITGCSAILWACKRHNQTSCSFSHLCWTHFSAWWCFLWCTARGTCCHDNAHLTLAWEWFTTVISVCKRHWRNKKKHLVTGLHSHTCARAHTHTWKAEGWTTGFQYRVQSFGCIFPSLYKHASVRTRTRATTALLGMFPQDSKPGMRKTLGSTRAAPRPALQNKKAFEQWQFISAIIFQEQKLSTKL